MNTQISALTYSEELLNLCFCERAQLFFFRQRPIDSTNNNTCNADVPLFFDCPKT